MRIQRGDGSIGWEHSIGHPRYDAEGNCVGVLVVMRDVTETKLADEVLKRKEAELRAIMDNAPLAIFLKDRRGEYRLVNRSYCDWMDLRPEQIYGRTSAEFSLRKLPAAWKLATRRCCSVAWSPWPKYRASLVTTDGVLTTS